MVEGALGASQRELLAASSRLSEVQASLELDVMSAQRASGFRRAFQIWKVGDHVTRDLRVNDNDEKESSYRLELIKRYGDGYKSHLYSFHTAERLGERVRERGSDDMRLRGQGAAAGGFNPRVSRQDGNGTGRGPSVVIDGRRSASLLEITRIDLDSSRVSSPRKFSGGAIEILGIVSRGYKHSSIVFYPSFGRTADEIKREMGAGYFRD
ncbi:hypothetical protein F5887DRAFT_931918 [Amanita rubescens]|nr:hypothetical protein F5887DRAFT_931918 [Amanita rubescens]